MLRFVPVLAALVVVGVFAGVAAACGDGEVDDDVATVVASSAVSGSPGAGGTATPGTGVTCPVDTEACAFAGELSAWLRDTDAGAVFAHSRATEVTCSGLPPGSGVDPTLPLCQGAPAGDVRRGYPVARLQSEPVTFDEAMLQRALETRFGSDYPTRELELATIGCPIPAAGAGASCEEAFAVVFRAPEGAQPQSLLGVIVDRTTGEPRIVRYYSGLIELNREMVEGGRAEEHTLIFPGSAGTEYVPVTEAR